MKFSTLLLVDKLLVKEVDEAKQELIEINKSERENGTGKVVYTTERLCAAREALRELHLCDFR